MDVGTTTQLREWLIEHAEQIIARWAAAIAQDWTAEVPPPPTVNIRRIYETLLTAPAEGESAAQQQLQALSMDWQAIGLPSIIRMSFQLRSAIVGVLASQGNELHDSPQFSSDLDAFIEEAVTTLSFRYNEHVQAELREQVVQAEYLLNHQAQMAYESDHFALQLSTLYELSQTLSASLDREHLLELVGPRLISAFGVQACALVLAVDGGWQIERAWGESWPELTGRTLDAATIPPALVSAGELGTLQFITNVTPADGNWLLPNQGALFVPLMQESHVLGCLVAQSDSLIERIDDTTMNLWRTVANQFVVTLENTRLYNEVQHLNADLERKVDERTAELSEERDRLEAIADIARDISTLEIDVLLNRILQALANLTGVQHGSVMLIDSGTGLLVDRAVLSDTSGSSSHSTGSRRFQMGEGVVGWIAQHRQPALVNNVQKDERWVQVDAFGQTVGKSTGSLVGMPLIAGDDVVGVLMLSHPKVDFFNQSHMRLLKAIAGEIAIAIYNAQLYEFLGERTNKLYTMLRHQEEASSQNNAILQSLNDAVIVFSTDRSIILANAAAERILAKPIDELVTQSFDELLSSLNIKLPGDPLGDVLANPVDHNGDHQRSITIKRGPQSLSISLVPVLTERGELLGACLIGRDITREVESDRLKTEFIGTVSHELRTPMTSIKGYTQLLAMGSLGEVNPTQKEFLTTITTNAERMIAIINDLLDITKIETGSVDLQPSRMHVAEVLSAVVSSNRLDLSQREHELALNLSPNLPLLWGDPERLRQVVQNILTNAIKYTPRGGKIAITAREIAPDDIPTAQREGLPGKRRYIAIAVQDTGVGIDSAEQERIFERFYRTENPLKIEAGGTGLGLSLVRPLLNLMGGRIWVASTAGQGSTFTFTMPVAPAD
jgi:signal transduction histidine kinase